MTAGRRRRDRTAAYVVAGMAAVLAAAAIVGVAGGGGDETVASTTAAADAWVAAAEEAFAPIQQLPEVASALDGWRHGNTTAADAAAQLASLDAALGTIEPALADLGPHPDAPLAAPLHLATARLYDVVVDVEATAVALAAGDAATQVDRAARRLQVLANRVFDRGRAAVGLGPAADLGRDVVVHRPDEVPSWADEDLAAGPPLAGTAPAAPAGPAVDWLTATRALVPTVMAVGDEAPPADLVAHADRLEAAVVVLRRLPDPDGGDRRTRVLLGLLLRAEAARLAAAATVTGGAELRSSAEAVESVATDPAFWDDELGALPLPS